MHIWIINWGYRSNLGKLATTPTETDIIGKDIDGKGSKKMVPGFKRGAFVIKHASLQISHHQFAREPTIDPSRGHTR